MMLETVAAVPGMVGGMLLHCKSLRKFETSGGWIKALLEEAENERMHLMTFMEVAKPKWWERALVFAVQGGFFNVYFLLYLASPKLAHRITGYLEEEAIWSYTQFIKEIDAGRIPNGPAPPIAIDYWRLPKNATIRDVVMVVRADEAHHRDVNHFAAVRPLLFCTSPYLDITLGFVTGHHFPIPRNERILSFFTSRGENSSISGNEGMISCDSPLEEFDLDMYCVWVP